MPVDPCGAMVENSTPVSIFLERRGAREYPLHHGPDPEAIRT
jgi:hypothetical protein